jgi:hypothetical protein
MKGNKSTNSVGEGAGLWLRAEVPEKNKNKKYHGVGEVAGGLWLQGPEVLEKIVDLFFSIIFIKVSGKDVTMARCRFSFFLLRKVWV